MYRQSDKNLQLTDQTNLLPDTEMGSELFIFNYSFIYFHNLG